jgi:hypothetical protein
MGHKCFWGIDKEVSREKTITEMIFVDDDVKDGLYLLNLQIISLEIDASPSRPILFQLEEL